MASIVRQIVERFFPQENSYLAMAPSNSAARGVGGDTMHSRLMIHGKASFRLPVLAQNISNDLIDLWGGVAVLVVEEVSMISPSLYGAASFRVSCARRRTCNADPNLYTEAGGVFGGIPIVLLLVDFMQLPTFEQKRQRASLLKDASGSPESLGGHRAFWHGLSHVVFFHKTHRFVDTTCDPPTPCPILPRLFEYMRSPGGKRMPDDLWQAIQRSRVTDPNDARLRQPRLQAGYEMAILWDAVYRLMQYRAVREARSAGQMLMYVQAVDVARKVELPRVQYIRALQVVNVSNTGKLMSMLPLFLGMRVRLTAKLSAKYRVVQDAVGEVVGIEFDAREFASQASDWRDNELHPARRRGWVRLRYLPSAVHVRVDHYSEDVGAGPGVVLVAG